MNLDEMSEEVQLPEFARLDPANMFKDCCEDLNRKRSQAFRNVRVTNPTWLLKTPVHPTDRYNENPNLDIGMCHEGKLTQPRTLGYYPRPYRRVIFTSESFNAQNLQIEREPLFSLAVETQASLFKKYLEQMSPKTPKIVQKIFDMNTFKLLYIVLLDILHNIGFAPEDLPYMMDSYRQATSGQKSAPTTTRTTLFQILTNSDILHEYQNMFRHRSARNIFDSWENLIQSHRPDDDSLKFIRMCLKLCSPGKYLEFPKYDFAQVPNEALGWCNRCFIFECDKHELQTCLNEDGLTNKAKIQIIQEKIPYRNLEEVADLRWEMKISQPERWDGRYQPCKHEGTCNNSDDCICCKVGSFCDKWCGCDATCGRRWRGCDCSARQKDCANFNGCPCKNNHRECDEDLCYRCGDANDGRQDGCKNLNIQTEQFKSTKVIPSKYGFGLAVMERARPGDYIGDYTGEITSRREELRRYAYYHVIQASYIFVAHNRKTTRQDHIIDSFHFGNKTRFVNDPRDSKTDNKDNANTTACVTVVRGELHLPLFVENDIKVTNPDQTVTYAKCLEPGSELSLSYGDVYWKLLGTEN